MAGEKNSVRKVHFSSAFGRSKKNRIGWDESNSGEKDEEKEGLAGQPPRLSTSQQHDMPRRTQASRSTPRPMSTFRQLYVQRGRILWLPKKAEIEDQSLLNDVTLDDNAYDHPVVVVHIDPLAKRVTLYLLTSRNPSGHVQQHRLPIFPSPPNSVNGLQLHLDDSENLDKPSYVRIEKPYSIPWAIIRPYRQNKVYKFTQESFDTLIRYHDLHTSGSSLGSSLGDIENAIQNTIRRPAQTAQPGSAGALQWPDPSQNEFRPAHQQRDGVPPAQTYPSRRFPSQRPSGSVRPPVHRRDHYEEYLRARLVQHEGAEPNIPWRLVFVLAGLGIAFFYYPYLRPRARARWIRGRLTFVWDSLNDIFTPITKAFRFLRVLLSPSTHHDVLAWVQGSLRPRCQSLVLGLRGVLDKWPSPVSFLRPLPEAPDNAFMKDLASRGEEIVRGYGERIGGLLNKLPSPVSFPGPLPEVPDNAFMKELASRGEGIVRGYGERIGEFLQQRK